MAPPRIVGIVNITADSFSDGGRFLDPSAAIKHARRLISDGADIVELGAVASNVASTPVSPAEEIARLDPVITALADNGVPLSVDTYQPEVQRTALDRGLAYLNDIRGFPDRGIYPDLAMAGCRLIVMHSVLGGSRAERQDLGADEVWARVEAFFADRLTALEAAGIRRDRLILDPGMGFFLSSRPEASFRVLAGIPVLKKRFGLPVMISVSRKSFLGALTGQGDPRQRGAATLAAELYAARHGADFIRTHDVASLRDALAVMQAVQAEEGTY